MAENKSSFFQVTIDLMLTNDYQIQSIENSMDLVLSAMKVNATWYKFLQKDREQIVYLFKSEDRKRRGQLDRYCAQNLPDKLTYNARHHTSGVFYATIERLKNNKNFILKHKPEIFGEYVANDIRIFDDRKKWHTWQKDVYDMIFTQDGNYKMPDQRKIISLVDKKGNSGKSSFFKWLFYKHPDSIGRIGYGTASQLRSGAVNLGKKNFYIIDLARAKSKDDRQEDLLSVLEDLKTGLITNAMYGSGKTLIMEPPHILVSSNYVLDYKLLSEDRWQVFEITTSNKLKSVNPKKIQQVEEKQRLKK